MTSHVLHAMLLTPFRSVRHALGIWPLLCLLLAPNTLSASEAGWNPKEPTVHALRRTQRILASREDHGKHFFLGTSAIPLRAGEGWYKNTMVSLNSAGYGLTRHLAVSGGLDLLSFVSSRAAAPRWFTRMQVSGSPGELVHVGMQAMYVGLPLPQGADVGASAGSAGFFGATGMCTIGTTTHQLTLSGGMVHDGSADASPKAVVGLAGMVRVAPNLALITEHWWLPEPGLNYPLHSAGVRVLGSFLAVDVGLAYDRELAARVLPIGLPFVAATLNF